MDNQNTDWNDKKQGNEKVEETTQQQASAQDAQQEQKKTRPITKDMLIAEVIQRKPRTIQTLMLIGMGCIGCPSSMMESVEQAAYVHGIDPDMLVEKLNAV